MSEEEKQDEILRKMNEILDKVGSMDQRLSNMFAIVNNSFKELSSRIPNTGELQKKQRFAKEFQDFVATHHPSVETSDELIAGKRTGYDYLVFLSNGCAKCKAVMYALKNIGDLEGINIIAANIKDSRFIDLKRHFNVDIYPASYIIKDGVVESTAIGEDTILLLKDWKEEYDRLNEEKN